MFDKATHVDAHDIEDHLARFDLLDVENVVDETHQPLAVGMRDRNQARHAVGQLRFGIPGEQTERGCDGGERRAQFVAHRRDELVLQTLYALALSDVDHNAENEEPLRRLDGIESDLDWKLRAVLAQAGQLVFFARQSRF